MDATTCPSLTLPWLAQAIRCRLGERLGLLVFLLANCLVQFLYYALQADALLETTKPSPTSADKALLLTYTLALLLCLALGFFALGLLVPVRSRDRLWGRIVIALATVLWLLIIVNSKVFSTLGVHVYSRYVVNCFGNTHIADELHLGTGTVLSAVIFVVLLILAQTGLFRLCRRLGRLPRQKLCALVNAVVFAALAVWFVSLVAARHLLQQAAGQGNFALAALPLHGPLFENQHAASRLRLDYPQVSCPLPTMSRKDNILFIVVESFRSDVICQELTPNIVEFTAHRPGIHSQRHYSGSHTTPDGVFAALYGLNSYHFKTFVQEGTPSYPLEVLKHNGYLLAGASAAKLYEWHGAGTMVERFDVYKQFCDEKVYRNDRNMVGWIEQFSQSRDRRRPFFLFVFMNSTHHNYQYPPEFERHKPVFPEDHNYMMDTGKLADSRELIFNRYKNSVTYIDHLFGRLMRAFQEELDNDNLIVVIIGDHAEEFWEKGLLGHGATRFINERTQTPLVFSLPGGKDRRVAISSHVDLLPTILDHAGLEPAVAAAGYTNGRSLLTSCTDDRYVVVTGAGFPYENEYLCLIGRGYKYWMKQRSGRLDDLVRVQTTRLDDTVVADDEGLGEFDDVFRRFRRDVFTFFERP